MPVAMSQDLPPEITPELVNAVRAKLDAEVVKP
jgi:hypothetical protein